MKTAVFYSGQFRSFEICYPNNFEKVLSKLTEYDVFLDIETPDVERVTEFITKNVTNLRAYNIYSEKKNLVDVRIKPKNLRGTVEIWLRQLKSIYDSFQLCDDTHKYDIAIRMRTDNIYLNDLEDLSCFELSNIYIPNHDNWFGYNDRFWISSIENMKRLTDIYIELPNMGELSQYNAESYIKYYIDEYCKIPVRRTSIVGQTIREDGTPVEIFYN
jgi:hypothetical protein